MCIHSMDFIYIPLPTSNLRDNRQGNIVLPKPKVNMILTVEALNRSITRISTLNQNIQNPRNSTYRSTGELCWKIPDPCVSPLATSNTIFPPFSTTTFVGQISTSTG